MRRSGVRLPLPAPNPNTVRTETPLAVRGSVSQRIVFAWMITWPAAALVAAAAPLNHPQVLKKGVRMQAFLLVLALAADLAYAQSVYKCQGLDGRVTYQNTACTGPTSGAQMQHGRLQGNTVSAPPAPKTEPTASPPSTGQAAKCYEDDEARDIEVRLASLLSPPDVKAFLRTEQRRLLACDYATLSADERRRRTEALRELGSTDASRREAAMSAVNGMYLQKRRQAEKTGGK
jgi:hypothetical protein